MMSSVTGADPGLGGSGRMKVVSRTRAENGPRVELQGIQQIGMTTQRGPGRPLVGAIRLSIESFNTTCREPATGITSPLCVWRGGDRQVASEDISQHALLRRRTSVARGRESRGCLARHAETTRCPGHPRRAHPQPRTASLPRLERPFARESTAYAHLDVGGRWGPGSEDSQPLPRYVAPTSSCSPPRPTIAVLSPA